MTNLEKYAGLKSIMPSGKERDSLRKSFEAQILNAALLRGYISPDKYLELFKRRVGDGKKKR